MEGNISSEKYNAIKESKATHNLQVDICYNCYYEITKYHSMSGSQMHGYLSLVKSKPKGTRRLYPEINIGKAIRKLPAKDNQRIYNNEISEEKQDYESKSEDSKEVGGTVSRGHTKSVTKASIFKTTQNGNKQFALNLIRSPTKRSSMKEISLKHFPEESEAPGKYGRQRGDMTTKSRNLTKFPDFNVNDISIIQKKTRNTVFAMNKLKSQVTP